MKPDTSCIYLDHNATTPIDPRVLAAMEPYLRESFGNPSSVEHEHGHRAGVAIDHARQQVAAAFGARPQEIIFTGGCTEANNLAILGVARAADSKRHIITTQIEHPAILEPVRFLERQGWRVTYLGVDSLGQVSSAAIAAAIVDDTALVTVMAANNEVGSLQPIQEIGAICAARGVLFHTDVAQMSAYAKINVDTDNIHLASVSAHKAYGPKGVGALYVRSRRPRVRIEPIIFGGGQEKGLRPGTLNTPAIVGMGEAISLAHAEARVDSARLRILNATFYDYFTSNVSGVQLNGHPTERIASNLSISIEGIEPLALIRHLKGQLSFSASSACATDKIQTSHVLLALYGDTQRARQAFRISPGRFTTAVQMHTAAHLIVEAAHHLRRACV